MRKGVFKGMPTRIGTPTQIPFNSAAMIQGVRADKLRATSPHETKVPIISATLGFGLLGFRASVAPDC
jgi:hypothetical protein